MQLPTTALLTRDQRQGGLQDKNFMHSLSPAAIKLPLQTDIDSKITKPVMLLAGYPKEMGLKQWSLLLALPQINSSLITLEITGQFDPFLLKF